MYFIIILEIRLMKKYMYVTDSPMINCRQYIPKIESQDLRFNKRKRIHTHKKVVDFRPLAFTMN